MARTYTDVPEPRYVERAKFADNGGGEITPESLLENLEGGTGIAVDLSEDESKVAISKDVPIIQLTEEQVVETEPPTALLTEEQYSILDNPNADIVEIDATELELGKNYFIRSNAENGLQLFLAESSISSAP